MQVDESPASDASCSDDAVFRKLVREVIEADILPLSRAARAEGRFPVDAFRALGAAEIIEQRWAGGAHGDQVKGAILSEELGRMGDGGIAACLGVQVEAIQSILRRYGQAEKAQQILKEACDGRATVCLAFSEASGGSDLNGLRTKARRQSGGWHLTGQKKYISLGSVSDHALVLASLPDEDEFGGIPALGLFLIDRDHMEVTATLAKAGNDAMDTVQMEIDAHVPEDWMLGRAGRGLVVANWGLLHERFGISAAVVGACRLAIELTATRLRRRTSFGRKLIEHQALRLDLARLHAQVLCQREAVYGVARMASNEGMSHATVSSLKLVSANLGERVASECLQLFGGLGYLTEEAPMADIWRDIRLARIAAGTEHMLLEMVATDLPDVDPDRYLSLVDERGDLA